MAQLLDETAKLGKQAYLLQPDPQQGPTLIPAEP
jgi:hypothetical protein